VVIGSISAALPSPWPQYAAAKAALESVTRSLAAELAPEGIRVNCIRPGSVRFPGGAWEGYATAEPDAYAAFVAADLPWGRLGRPEEIADVAAFVLSPRASWMTGAVIPVDGGQRRSSPYPTTDSH
jgi:3-oxoacyl-[acyl-carrier protein] reductase